MHRLVSLACSTPPEGAARWTLSRLTEKAVRRGIAPVGSDIVHKILKRHDEERTVHSTRPRAIFPGRLRRLDGSRAGAAW